MPITFTVAPHTPNAVRPPYQKLTKAEDLLARTWEVQALSKGLKCKELLQSSIEDKPGSGFDWASVHPQDNGFVRTLIQAYNQHHNLVLRPDDVWTAILNQLNLFVNAHSEELRAYFVEHEGQKEVEVKAGGNRYTVDFGHLAKQFRGEMEKFIVDKTLQDWLLPTFSTTTHNDSVIFVVMMMATLKKYFSYKMSLSCGIPSVTLEGTREDWETLLERLNASKLPEAFAKSEETQAFFTLLNPILSRFVSAFDAQDGNLANPEDKNFWSKICHSHSFGSGPTYLSGWLTALISWDEQGKWIGPPLEQFNPSPNVTLPPPKKTWVGSEIEALSLDGVSYTFIEMDQIAPGYCEVDVLLDDNGHQMKCLMVAGHVGSQALSKEDNTNKFDTLKPLSSWFIFEKEQRAVAQW